jgi:hypothetical protein
VSSGTPLFGQKKMKFFHFFQKNDFLPHRCQDKDNRFRIKDVFNRPLDIFAIDEKAFTLTAI